MGLSYKKIKGTQYYATGKGPEIPECWSPWWSTVYTQCYKCLYFDIFLQLYWQWIEQPGMPWWREWWCRVRRVKQKGRKWRMLHDVIMISLWPWFHTRGRSYGHSPTESIHLDGVDCTMGPERHLVTTLVWAGGCHQRLLKHLLDRYRLQLTPINAQVLWCHLATVSDSWSKQRWPAGRQTHSWTQLLHERICIHWWSQQCGHNLHRACSKVDSF